MLIREIQSELREAEKCVFKGLLLPKFTNYLFLKIEK